MTNEEKAKEFANYFAGETDYKESAAYSSAMAMAEWKDEQHKKEIADLQRKLNAEKELRKQVEDSVRGLPQPIKDLIKAMNMII